MDNTFEELLALAFSEDPDVALKGSIALAKHIGVPDNEIIHDEQELEEFLNGES